MKQEPSFPSVAVLGAGPAQLCFGKAHILLAAQRAGHLKPPCLCCCGYKKALCCSHAGIGREADPEEEGKDCGIF